MNYQKVMRKVNSSNMKASGSTVNFNFKLSDFRAFQKQVKMKEKNIGRETIQSQLDTDISGARTEVMQCFTEGMRA